MDENSHRSNRSSGRYRHTEYSGRNNTSFVDLTKEEDDPHAIIIDLTREEEQHDSYHPRIIHDQMAHRIQFRMYGILDESSSEEEHDIRLNGVIGPDFIFQIIRHVIGDDYERNLAIGELIGNVHIGANEEELKKMPPTFEYTENMNLPHDRFVLHV